MTNLCMQTVLCHAMPHKHMQCKCTYNGLMKQLTPGNNKIFNSFYISIYYIYFNMCVQTFIKIFTTEKKNCNDKQVWTMRFEMWMTRKLNFENDDDGSPFLNFVVVDRKRSSKLIMSKHNFMIIRLHFVRSFVYTVFV